MGRGIGTSGAMEPMEPMELMEVLPLVVDKFQLFTLNHLQLMS